MVQLDLMVGLDRRDHQEKEASVDSQENLVLLEDLVPEAQQVCVAQQERQV